MRNDKYWKICAGANMKRTVIFLIFAVFLFGCSDNPVSVEEPDPLDFTKMEIHYKRMLGGVAESSLDAQSDGSVETFGHNTKLGHDLNTFSDLLTEEKELFAQLFVHFDEFDRLYGPESGSRFSQVEFIYEGVPDTVTITSFLTVPAELEDITDALDITIARLTNPRK